MLQQARAGSDNSNQAAAVKFPDGSQRAYPGVPVNVFDKCSQEDLAIVVLWNGITVAAVLPHLIKQRPAWFHQDHSTVEEFKDDLFQHCCLTLNGLQARYGSDMIVPLTFENFSQVKDNFANICTDTSIVNAYRAAFPDAVRVPALATLHVVYEASRPANARSSIVGMVPAHGVQAFI